MCLNCMAATGNQQMDELLPGVSRSRDREPPARRPRPDLFLGEATPGGARLL